MSKYSDKIADICVDAVLQVADMERKEVNLELIKVVNKPGGGIGDIRLIQGILLDKELSHPQMQKQIENAKIAIVTCPFEPPKPKTKYNLEIKTGKQYEQVAQAEQDYFVEMVKLVKQSGADIVFCQ